MSNLQNYRQKVNTFKKQPYRVISKINYSQNSTHISQKNIYKNVLPNNTADKVIWSAVQRKPTTQRYFRENLKILRIAIPRNTIYN